MFEQVLNIWHDTGAEEKGCETLKFRGPGNADATESEPRTARTAVKEEEGKGTDNRKGMDDHMSEVTGKDTAKGDDTPSSELLPVEEPKNAFSDTPTETPTETPADTALNTPIDAAKTSTKRRPTNHGSDRTGRDLCAEDTVPNWYSHRCALTNDHLVDVAHIFPVGLRARSSTSG